MSRKIVEEEMELTSEELDAHESQASSGPLGAVVDEARTHFTPPEMDWTRLEARLMASVEAKHDTPEAKPEKLADVVPLKKSAPTKPEKDDERQDRRSRLLRAGAVILAVAAAAALVMRAGSDPKDQASTHERAPDQERAVASSLLGTEGSGQVKINDVVATAGHTLRAGDTIDTTSARALFDRPGKVAWLVEHDVPTATAHAKVKLAGKAPSSVPTNVDEPLVLGLDDGAIEAQVTPVPAGEAFAVDIATPRTLVRVAVHGTHLRVVRKGTKVTVDLTEGVVSIGTPPRVGMTTGTLATAPAHVEFDAADLGGTLRIDHTPANVRAAIPLGSGATRVVKNDPAPSDGLLPKPNAGHEPAPRKNDQLIVPPNPTHVAPLPKPLPPREAIAAAVRECAAQKSRAGAVRVTIASSLELKVDANGKVEMAQFKPPLLPEIQECAATTIYKQKLEETGTVTVPIEFSY